MDVQSLMKQAQEMQAKVSMAQESLAAMSIKGMAGAGAAIVELNGKYDLIKLTLAPSVAGESPDDIAALVSAAYMDAKAQVDKTIDNVMGAATAGMPIPA